MSIEESTKAIARRDAQDRAARISTEQEALQLIVKAQSSGDTTLVEALRAHIAIKWPLPRTNWLDKLTATNSKLTSILSERHRDPFVKKLADDYKAGRVNHLYVASELEATNKAPRYSPVLDAIDSEAVKVNEKAAMGFERKLLELTSLSGDVNTQLLTEMRASKEWDRLQREISGKSGSEVASKIIEMFKTGSIETRYMLLGESPSFMQNLGYPDFRSVLIQTLIQVDADLARENQEKISAGKYVAATRFNVRYVREYLAKLPPANSSLREDEAPLVKKF